MTTKGPIYRMLEEIVRSSEIDEAIGHLEDILPKIQSLEPVWIPVTERLPELGTEVVFTVGNSMYIGSSDLYDGKRLWTENNLYRNIKNVTHWMNLPLPPTE